MEVRLLSVPLDKNDYDLYNARMWISKRDMERAEDLMNRQTAIIVAQIGVIESGRKLIDELHKELDRKAREIPGFTMNQYSWN